MLNEPAILRYGSNIDGRRGSIVGKEPRLRARTLLIRSFKL
jgi:hypothetical protein